MPSRKELKQAVADARQVANRDQEILGTRHPETLRSQMKLAKALIDAGENRSANTLLGKLLPVEREVHGESAREVLQVEQLLAPLQRSLGALQIVKARQERLLAAIIRDQGTDTDLTIWVMREFARTLLDLGLVDEAAALLETAVEACVRLHGDLHMETLSSMTWLAKAKRGAHDNTGAQILDTEVLRRAISMDAQPRFILDVKRHLIADASGLGQWVEVMELTLAVVNEVRTRLPEDDELRVSIERQHRLLRMLMKNPRTQARRVRQLTKILEDPVRSERLNRRMRRSFRKQDLPDL